MGHDSTALLMATDFVVLLVSTVPVHGYKNVFLDNKFALPSLSPPAGQELVCKVRIHMSSIWRGGADQENISGPVTGCVSRMGLGSGLTEKQGNINQDINPAHCAVSRGEAVLLLKKSL